MLVLAKLVEEQMQDRAAIAENAWFHDEYFEQTEKFKLWKKSIAVEPKKKTQHEPNPLETEWPNPQFLAPDYYPATEVSKSIFIPIKI